MGTRVSFSGTLSKPLVIEEDENTPPNPKLMEFRFDKVFPVYAMGVLKPDPDLLLTVPSSGSDLDDPIWDAVREEAKLEVPTILKKVLLIWVYVLLVVEFVGF